MRKVPKVWKLKNYSSSLDRILKLLRIIIITKMANSYLGSIYFNLSYPVTLNLQSIEMIVLKTQ